jgi:cytochrome o ubiquinol oxidase subunit I
MDIFAGLLGKLNMHVFPTVMLTLGAAVSMLLIVLALAGYITFKKRWKWLWNEWLTSVDPKKIGIMYIIVALVMLLRGGSDALLLRAQQATSVGASHGIMSSSTFQQIFSAHGTIMIFFVAMGLMFGLINLIVPLQIGARDVAFPFLNLTSFWLFAAGMVLVNLSLGVGDFSAAGWLAYPPLSELQYSPGVGVDYWIWSLQIAGIGSLLSGVNFTTTIFKMRCAGMTLMKMPLFVWSVLCSMLLVLFAFPILTVTLALLFLDRTIGTNFFTASGGGNIMMYVNLIWAWGHPEVYILILPSFGVFSEVVATFSRKRLFGYTTMVWALGAITILSFSVWLHHFFTMGAGADVNGFFGIMTMVIAIPTGVKIFNWIATMYRGRISYKTPMFWFLGFIGLFTVGGVAGVVMAVPPADFQLHNSLFLVAHFHTMIVSGVLFGDFAAINYWFPKFFGFKLNHKLGKYSFWCWFVGFLLAFIPLYILGLMGATRRIDHYSPSLGWQPLFVVAAIGAVIIAIGVGLMILQIIVSVILRRQTIDTTGDPWNGRTLEWSTTSPPPFYNFAVAPVVHDRDAFWDLKNNPTSNKSKQAVVYEDITIPKNAPASVLIGIGSLLFGFGMIWHIWWLSILCLLALIIIIITRVTSDDTDYVLKAAEVKVLEEARAEGQLA